MSKFSKPHSYPSPTPAERYQRFNRKRIYPYWISFSSVAVHGSRCEACARSAKWALNYVEHETSNTLSKLFLCDEHKSNARAGNFDRIWRDMNKKLEGVK